MDGGGGMLSEGGIGEASCSFHRLIHTWMGIMLLLGRMCCASLCKLLQCLFILLVLCTWQVLLMYINRVDELFVADTQGLSGGWLQNEANKQLRQTIQTTNHCAHLKKTLMEACYSKTWGTKIYKNT